MADESVCPEQLGQVAPLKRLLELGLTAREAEELDIREPLLQSIREYIGSEAKSSYQPEQTLQAVNNTLKVIAEQVQSIDLEVQMLNLRKKALKRRSRILDRLAESLNNHLDQHEAA
jgi:hypothetical protein